MNKRTKLIVISVVIAALVVGAAVLYNTLAPKLEINNLNQNNENTAGANGQSEATYLDFTVEDIDGNYVKLSDFEGTPVVLNFWASWCGPCKREMPDFDKVHEEYAGKVEFMMVNLTDGYQETRESALEYITNSGYNLPVYFDATNQAALTYEIYSVPQTFFIDERGNIVAHATGMINKETLKEGIGMIYNEK